MTIVERVNAAISRQDQTIFRFLTPSEQRQIKRESSVYFDGGYAGAERKRVFLDCENNDDITCFELDYSTDELPVRHQDILGSLMALGIERDCIGDILPKQRRFYVIRELKDEILHSLTMIGQLPVRLHEIDGTDSYLEYEYSPGEFLSESLRLDLLVAKITHKSRSEAYEMILQEHVKVNHLVETKHAKIITEGSILSIRHFGRYILDDTKQTTKKGKIVVKYRKFV